jgi:hypothetical protein
MAPLPDAGLRHHFTDSDYLREQRSYGPLLSVVPLRDLLIMTPLPPCTNAKVHLWQSPDGTWFETFAVPGYEGFDNPIGNRSNATQTPAAEVLASRGLCTITEAPAQPIPTGSPALENSISGNPIPLPLLAIGAVALAAWGLQKSSDYGRQKRIEKYRPPAALPGGHVGQEALYPSEPTSDEPWNGGGLPGSGSFSADQGSMRNGPHSGFTEPCPWSATEAQKSAYVDDRTGSDMSTADVWMVLKDCTFQEFQKRIRPGNVDPVPVVNDGVGAIAARDALYRWFQHGITQQNKCCFAAFGTDGKGDGSTARAARQLFKEHLAEWVQVNVRG